jgi:two-component system, NtrC family, sensor kinase
MTFEPILAFFLVRQLRKTLKTYSPHLVWEQRLLQAMYGIVVLALAELLLSVEPVTTWIWHLLLLLLFAVILKGEEFISMRTAVYAFLPLSVIMLAEDTAAVLNSDLHGKMEEYTNYVYPVAITWMIALLILYTKQQKALKKEHKRRLEEEEQKRMMAARKAELEMMVKERTAELMQQKQELQAALAELKATQQQLIHSEKMASLGELTAGIAHEIQNPLNFVNNFSEVSTELTEEIQAMLQKGEVQEALFLAADIKDNLQKITLHGKRADAIVKGMLQHARAGNGKKEPTNINALADEYLRLSYHGLRAKNKAFDATLTTDFDSQIAIVNIVPQEIGRVLLNVYNNAFYAVGEKKKQLNGTYTAEVFVSTKYKNGKIIISIKDNGIGISQKVLNKIYQPFFTTKPSGEGTGLGLSLSYDIITKGHGGELKVFTKEGEGTEFIIQLPANQEA